MSDFLTNLVTLAQGLVRPLEPRVASLYEPASPAPAGTEPGARPGDSPEAPGRAVPAVEAKPAPPGRVPGSLQRRTSDLNGEFPRRAVLRNAVVEAPAMTRADTARSKAQGRTLTEVPASITEAEPRPAGEEPVVPRSVQPAASAPSSADSGPTAKAPLSLAAPSGRSVQVKRPSAPQPARESAPEVVVTIGRVEVKAVTGPKARVPERRAPSVRGVEEFLLRKPSEVDR